MVSEEGLGCVVEVTRIILAQAGQQARPGGEGGGVHRVPLTRDVHKRTTQKGLFPARRSELNEPKESLSPVSVTSRLCVMFDMEL